VNGYLPFDGTNAAAILKDIDLQPVLIGDYTPPSKFHFIYVK
jgi:hypothetical protein